MIRDRIEALIAELERACAACDGVYASWRADRRSDALWHEYTIAQRTASDILRVRLPALKDAILAALRRPEPAAVAVEVVARAIAGTYDNGRWDELDEEERDGFRLSAQAALSVLPRPAVDEGAVERPEPEPAADAVEALRAVMGLQSVKTLFEAAETYPHGIEDVAAELAALKLARAALAAAQEGQP